MCTCTGSTYGVIRLWSAPLYQASSTCGMRSCAQMNWPQNSTACASSPRLWMRRHTLTWACWCSGRRLRLTFESRPTKPRADQQNKSTQSTKLLIAALKKWVKQTFLVLTKSTLNNHPWIPEDLMTAKKTKCGGRMVLLGTTQTVYINETLIYILEWFSLMPIKILCFALGLFWFSNHICA